MRSELETWNRLKSFAVEWLFQRDAERRASERERDPERDRVVKACLRGADERLELLGALSERETAIAAVPALREVTRLLLEAAAPSRAPVDLAVELPRICDDIDVPPPTCSAGLRLLAMDDPIAVDELPPAELLECVHGLDEIARGLRAYLDGRTVERIVWARRVRIALTGVVIGYGVFAAGRAVFGPKNVARGQPVLLSSYEPKSAVPSKLVDGVRSADTPPGSPKPDIVLTRTESAPWARIDLGREYKIHEVRLYNRDDGEFDASLPYVVDFSLDGHEFWEVGRCENHFGSWWIDPPCRVDCDDRTTRYVRVRATHYLALSEVEVYP